MNISVSCVGRWLGMSAVAAGLALAAPLATSAAEVEVHEVTRERLERHLNAEQTRRALETLANVEQRTLGPQPLTEADRQRLAGPEARIELDAAGFAEQHGIEGDGSEAAPYRGLLRTYTEQLDRADVAVRVPAGHYQDVGVDVPEDVWLVAEGDVVIHAPSEREADTPGHIVSLVSGGGLIGFEIDGSAMPFEREPAEWRGTEYQYPRSEHRLTGVLARRRGGRGDRESNIVIAHNHIHHCVGDGIADQTYRRRWGAHDVLVTDNTIEYIGYRGIGGGAGWRIQNNIVRHAGILHPASGGGQDGIILGWINYHDGGSGDSEVVNNLVVSSRRLTGNARHGIATHVGHDILFAGNLIVLEGQVRGGLRFSDWSHHNRVIGNVVIGIPLEAQDNRLTRDAIGVSGQGNQIVGNATFGTGYFVNFNNMPADELRRIDEDPGDNIVRDNYAETPRSHPISQRRGPDRNAYSGNRFQQTDVTPVAGPLDTPRLPAFWYESQDDVP